MQDSRASHVCYQMAEVNKQVNSEEPGLCMFWLHLGNKFRSGAELSETELTILEMRISEFVMVLDFMQSMGKLIFDEDLEFEKYAPKADEDIRYLDSVIKIIKTQRFQQQAFHSFV